MGYKKVKKLAQTFSFIVFVVNRLHPGNYNRTVMVSKNQQASCSKSIRCKAKTEEIKIKKEKGKKQYNHINLLHLDILDNEEIFKGYPWRRLSYILTYQFLKKACYSDKDVVYLQGFPLALVYWAFEKIPRLSNLDVGFGRKLANEGPPIVTWECLETSDWRNLNIDIFEYENFSMTPMDSLEEESQTILRYFKNIEK
uniref:Uncharacterized protein n=1 Tax=Cucumis melo TaxID=3656 RepID=A0A9I9EHN2_CUCME